MKAAAILATLVVALAGCPHHVRKMLEPDVPKTGDARARSRFIDARAAFLKDGSHAEEFARLVDEFPQDPIAPLAGLYAGIASIKTRAFPEADKQLTPLVDSPDGKLAVRAQMYLGIAKNYEGDGVKARELFKRVEAARSECKCDPIENDDERTEYIAAVAYSFAAGDDPLRSLPWFDDLWPRLTPTERALAVERVEQIVAAAEPVALRRAFDALPMHEGPSFAVAGARLARSGQLDERVQRQIGKARERVGLPKSVAAAAGASGAGLVGAALAMDGDERRRGEQSAQGLAIAAGASGGKGVVALEVRGAGGVDDLAAKNVVAIVGPADKKSVEAAIVRAQAVKVPLISLSTVPEQFASVPSVFHIRHSAEARARTLARVALAKGAKSYAILRPENGYGRDVAEAFRAAIQQGGGTISATITYPKDEKSFGAVAKKAAQERFDALFVADRGDVLELVAPALDVAELVASPPGTTKIKNRSHAHPFLLLSTAEGLNASYLASAARHSRSALLAPGFYAGDDRPIAKAFVERYRAAFGHDPSAEAAYAYDAALLAGSGGGDRATLARLLETGQLAGVTGTVEFGADHRRKDDGLVYTVEDVGGTLAIHVLR